MGYGRDQQTFSVKGQIINIFGFVDHMVCVMNTQLWETAVILQHVVNEWMCAYVPIKTLFTKIGTGQLGS